MKKDWPLDIRIDHLVTDVNMTHKRKEIRRIAWNTAEKEKQ